MDQFFGKVDGNILPPFTAKDLNGKVYTEKDIMATATFLNFWFAACQPCIEEIPQLNRLYHLFKDSSDIKFFALTFETREASLKFVKKYNVKFPILLVSKETIKTLLLKRGYPTNMVIDSNRSVHTITHGFKNPDHFVLYFKRELEKLLIAAGK
ncbi:MAG TPA: TlpA disulfide reductase family protein [Chitinophagaceae bacterium]